MSNERPEVLLNLSGWIERRKDAAGPYADHIIHSVLHYECEIARLRTENDELRKMLSAAADIATDRQPAPHESPRALKGDSQ